MVGLVVIPAEILGAGGLVVAPAEILGAVSLVVAPAGTRGRVEEWAEAMDSVVATEEEERAVGKVGRLATVANVEEASVEPRVDLVEGLEGMARSRKPDALHPRKSRWRVCCSG